ncbi:MAG: M23 family metallopeptidase [Endomicrobium sp.]|jgi:murein DD-endopeptidase MepM/ murein hydrolase activator NlpD|nr:M23 family metallopeptidase [Endomicrobium sp.]
MRIIHKIKGELEKRVTIMFIPHDRRVPFKISFSLSFICTFIILWIILTVCACYTTIKYSDYIITKADNKIMRVRLLLFAAQIEKTKNILKKVQINDEKIRSLLALDTKKSIIEEGLGQNLGEGGPTSVQANTFAIILSGNLNKINYSAISQKNNTLYEQYKFLYQSYSEIMSHIDKQKLLFMAIPRGWPCNGYVSSVYGFRAHPIFLSRDFHSGLDIANKFNTSISSTADGKVIFSGWQSGYGNVIVIDHDYDYRTVYGHLNKRLVNKGVYVSRGQIIAKMGSTGTSTSSHLHYEVHFKGKSINPKPYLTDYFFTQSEGKHYDKKKFKKFA